MTVRLAGRRTRRFLAAAVSIAAATFLTTPAIAEPATLIRGVGASNRLHLAVLGDGYTTDELPKFAADAEKFMAAFFAQLPYADYASYFDVYRIDVASPQSGASHPESGITKTTAFSASYNCNGTLRLVCANIGAVNTVLARSLSPEQRDFAIVLVNDSQYGGSGGAVAISSTNIAGIEILLHEMGHTLGLLGDEYPDGGTCVASELPYPNVTTVESRPSIKWRHWIDESTPIPTTITAPAVPGLYLGARFCAAGQYRPTYNSKMRTLGLPFDQVNGEQLIKRFYNFVSPIDGFAPSTGSVVVRPGEAQTFSVITLAPASHALSVTWTLDGVPVGTGNVLALPGTAVATGPHTLQAIVRDVTAAVRSDAAGALQAVQTWTVSGG